MLLTLVTFFIILSLLVFVHELGHFVMARKFGVKAEEFGFGFPPRIFGFYKTAEGKWKHIIGRGHVTDAVDTVYSVNWLPLGGFVKIKGEDGENTDPDSFVHKKIWQRAVILLAGVTMNIVLAMFLLSLGFMIGIPQVVENVSAGAKVTNQEITIVDVLPDSPAAKAGLKMEDVIINIDGQQFATIETIQSYVDQHQNKELFYLIKRADKETVYKLKPVQLKDTQRAGIGVAITETGIVSYPWYRAIFEGIKTTVYLTWAILMAFYNLLHNLIFGQGFTGEVAGPIGIAAYTGQVARRGFAYIIQFASLLSINLAIINALPIPALDGGRVLFLIIEKIKRRPVKKEVEGLIHNIGFALLMLLILAVTFRDLSKYADNFKHLIGKIIG